MSDILLSKPTLPDGWIDLSVGEPHIVKEILLNVFNLTPYELPNKKELFEYPPSNGYKPLVDLLENQYKAPIVITNGAKQGLAAVFYALCQMGKLKFSQRTPYWCLIEPLAKVHGLSFVEKDYDSYLCIAPNNPDGWADSSDELRKLYFSHKQNGIPFIHDAAYYTHAYMPTEYNLKSFGDVQIYSVSKQFGLSGCRLGYVVCHNVEFYKHVVKYMEMMTVGVSNISQVFLYDLLSRMHSYPTLKEQFENTSFLALQKSKNILKNVSPDILEIDKDIDKSYGMFGFFKIGKKANFTASKLNVVDGSLFGQPGYIRINLAFDETKMNEIVKRLNGVI